MRDLIPLISFSFFSVSAFGRTTKFDCPCRRGKIIEYFHSKEVAQKPGAEIQKNFSDVYYIMDGEVIALDSVKGDKRLYVRSGNFSFSFHKLSDINFIKGQQVSKGQ